MLRGSSMRSSPGSKPGTISPEPLETTLCPDIQTRLYGRSFDFTDPAERKAFNDGGGHNPGGCPMVCAIAAEAAARKILDLRQNG